jgi:3-oxoadipate enol-lactonase
MPTIKTNGATIYYEDTGAGIPIVFAHGGGGNHMSWYQQVPYFSKEYRCITFDQRSFGQSIDESKEFADAFQRDMEELLNGLNIDKAFLVAQSMGGYSCMPFAIRNPERVIKLVMSDTFAGLSSPSVTEAMRKHLAVENTDRQGTHKVFREGNPAGQFLYEQIRGMNPPRIPERDIWDTIESWVSPLEIENSTVPVLYIVGEEDEVVPISVIQEAHKVTPNSSVAVVSEAGHSVYFEKPDIFNYIVDQFFKQ